VEPSDEEPDPIRLKIKDNDLKFILKSVYEGTTSAKSDGLTLMREYIPVMYEKHSLERGRRVSQSERNQFNLTDECYSYGELDFEIFATIFEKFTRAYGQREDGIFYDVGCGVGKLVYTAALIGKFAKCGGIEKLGKLLDRGLKRKIKWEKVTFSS
jgi:hypothetical protein